MTALFADVPEPLATVGRLSAIVISLWIALTPARSIGTDVLLVLGGETAIPLLTSPAVGILILLVPAFVLARIFASYTVRFVLFAVLTLIAHFVVRWITGLSAEPLELATHILVAETLSYIAAVALAASISVHPGIDPRHIDPRQHDETATDDTA